MNYTGGSKVAASINSTDHPILTELANELALLAADEKINLDDLNLIVTEINKRKRLEPLQTPTLATAMSKDLAGNFDEFRDEIIRPSASAVDVTYTVSNASTNKGKIVTLHLQNNSGSAWAFTFAGGTTRLYKGDTTNLATDTLTIADATDVEVSIKAVAGDKLLIIITEYTA